MPLGDVSFRAMGSDSEEINSKIQCPDNLFVDCGQSWNHMNAQFGIPEAFPHGTKHLILGHEALSDLKRGGPQAIAMTYFKIGITGTIGSSSIGRCLIKADLVFVGMGTIAERGVTNDNLG
jgi:hypothetical protein